MSYPELDVTINDSPLRRRDLGFAWLDRAVFLQFETIYERETKRHKWREVSRYDRYSSRSTHSPAPVPQEIIAEMLRRVRESIVFVSGMP